MPSIVSSRSGSTPTYLPVLQLKNWLDTTNSLGCFLVVDVIFYVCCCCCLLRCFVMLICWCSAAAFCWLRPLCCFDLAPSKNPYTLLPHHLIAHHWQYTKYRRKTLEKKNKLEKRMNGMAYLKGCNHRVWHSWWFVWKVQKQKREKNYGATGRRRLCFHRSLLQTSSTTLTSRINRMTEVDVCR